MSVFNYKENGFFENYLVSVSLGSDNKFKPVFRVARINRCTSKNPNLFLDSSKIRLSIKSLSVRSSPSWRKFSRTSCVSLFELKLSYYFSKNYLFGSFIFYPTMSVISHVFTIFPKEKGVGKFSRLRAHMSFILSVGLFNVLYFICICFILIQIKK